MLFICSSWSCCGGISICWALPWELCGAGDREEVTKGTVWEVGGFVWWDPSRSYRHQGRAGFWGDLVDNKGFGWQTQALCARCDGDRGQGSLWLWFLKYFPNSGYIWHCLKEAQRGVPLIRWCFSVKIWLTDIPERARGGGCLFLKAILGFIVHFWSCPVPSDPPFENYRNTSPWRLLQSPL